MAAQWPVLYARLLELLPSLPSWGDVPVFDGPPVTGATPEAWATVGFAQLEDSAGTYLTDRSSIDGLIDETGSIRCELVARTGVVDIASVRARVFALLDELGAAMRADQTLGVLSPGSTTRLEVDVIPIQDSTGAVQRVAFNVSYLTSTPG